MSSVSPKPIIAQVARRWQISPGLTFALVRDVEGRVWIVQSCPAGTQFWTVAQAAQLPRGAQTRQALCEAVQAGRRLEQRSLALRLTHRPQRIVLSETRSEATLLPETIRPLARRPERRREAAEEKTAALFRS
jgi:hypothetical protein